MLQTSPSFFHTTGRDLASLVQAMLSLHAGAQPVLVREFLEAMRRLTGASGAAFIHWRTDPAGTRLDLVDQAVIDMELPSGPLSIEKTLRQRLGKQRRAGFTKWLDEINSVIAVAPQSDGLYAGLIVRVDRASQRRVGRLLLLALHAVQNRMLDVRLQRKHGDMPQSLRETFQMLLRGASEKEIAAATHKSVNTIHDHVKRLYQYFNVASRAQLLARFVDINLIA